jgi:AhpD family alkylhydroperoxidase
MARRDRHAAGAALVRARAAGVPRAEAAEVALMLVLHVGYPAALEATGVLLDRWPGVARRTNEGGVTRWRRRGEALARRVYGPVYEKLMTRVRAMHPDLATWMIEQGYGRVLSRRPLGERERELVAVAVLAATGWERQLTSHVIGARRMGAAPGAIRAAVRAGLRRASPDVRAAASRAVRVARG